MKAAGYIALWILAGVYLVVQTWFVAQAFRKNRRYKQWCNLKGLPCDDHSLKMWQSEHDV